MTHQELKKRYLIGDFLDCLPLNYTISLQINKEELERGTDPFNYEIRDFENPFCYDGSQLKTNQKGETFPPTVLEYENRYFIFGKEGYRKDFLTDHPEIDKNCIPYANAYFFKYDDWNVLMDVIDKIEKTSVGGRVNHIETLLAKSVTGKYYCEIIVGKNKTFLSSFVKTRKEATIESIINFIEWYNEIKSKRNE